MERGAGKNSILTMKDGIITRGVLYDIARLKGVPYLEPGTRIYPEDLEAWDRSRRFRRRSRCGRCAQSLGIHADDFAITDTERHRITD